MPLTIEQLKETREFISLTPKQRAFVIAYITNGGDRVAAVYASYSVSKDINANIMSYNLLSNPRIADVLDAYWQAESDEIVLKRLQRLMRKRKVDLGLIQAYRLYLSLKRTVETQNQKPGTPTPADQPKQEDDFLLDEFENQ